MKKDFIQFTYAYTKKKFDGTGDAGGIFTRTNSQEKNYAQECTNLSNMVTQNFQHNYSNNDKSMSSFGFNYTNESEPRPYIFTAFNNENFDADSMRGGECFAAHVCVGDALINKGYAIEYYNSKKNNMTINTIDNKSDVLPYKLLSDSDVESSKGDELTPNSIRGFQAKHIQELSMLLKYLLMSLAEDKKVFIVADEERKNDIPKWMAAVLMLLPATIANKISFNTYVPEPGDNNKDFRLYGTVLGMAKLDGLSDKGYVFKLGSQLVSNNSINPISGKLTDFLSSCNEEAFFKWIASVSDYYQAKNITLNDVDYLAEKFRLLNRKDVPIKTITEFVGSNLDNRFNKGEIEKEFFEITEDRADSINSDINDAFLVIKTLIQLVSNPYLDSVRVVDRLYYFIFGNRNSFGILSRIVSQGEKTFWGNSIAAITDYFTSEPIIGDIKSSLDEFVFKPNNGKVEVAIVKYLISFFSDTAFVKNNPNAEEILSMCAKELLQQKKVSELLDCILENVTSGTNSKIKFLVEFSINDGCTKHILDTRDDKNNGYALTLIESLKRNKLFDAAINIYSRYEQEPGIIELFLSHKWSEELYSLNDIFELLVEGNRYSGLALKAFQTNFTSICNEKFDKLLTEETNKVRAASSLEELESERIFIDKLLAAFKNYDGYKDKYINDLNANLKKVLDAKLIEERELHLVRNKRIEYILNKFRQLSDAKMLRLLKQADIDFLPKSDNSPYNGADAEAIMKTFLLQYPKSKADIDRKIEVCNIIDKASEKNKVAVKLAKDIKKTTYSLGMSLIFAVIIALLTGLACYFIYNGIGNGFFVSVYYLFTGLAFVVALVIYWHNFNILWTRLRITLTIVETVVIIVSYISIYLLITQILG